MPKNTNYFPSCGILSSFGFRHSSFSLCVPVSLWLVFLHLNGKNGRVELRVGDVQALVAEAGDELEDLVLARLRRARRGGSRIDRAEGGDLRGGRA